MSEDAFATVLGALVRATAGDWSVPAVAKALAATGRTVETVRPGRYAVRPAGDSLQVGLVADPDVTEAHAPGAIYGVEVTPTGRAVADLLAAARTVLGPALTLGGPGPWARWMDGAAWWTLSRSPEVGRVRLFVEPAPRAEQDEQRDVEFGALRGLPYLWRLDATAAPTSSRPARGPRVRTLAALPAQLHAVCASLAEAVTWLPGELPGLGVGVRTRKGERTLLCWFEPGRCCVQIDGEWAEHPAGGPGARAVAETAGAALLAWPVDDPRKRLRYTAPAPAGTVLSVPGIGLDAAT